MFNWLSAFEVTGTILALLASIIVLIAVCEYIKDKMGWDDWATYAMVMSVYFIAVFVLAGLVGIRQ